MDPEPDNQTTHTGAATDGSPRLRPMREVMEDKLRALTILCEGRELDEAFELIGQVTDGDTYNMSLHSKLDPADVRTLTQAAMWRKAVHARHNTVSLLVEMCLIAKLAEATGTTANDVVRQLASDMNDLMPPS